MVKKYKRPFCKTVFDKNIDDIIAPADLARYIDKGAGVCRYKFHENNFDHIFDDRVDEHTKRMVLYAEHLLLSDSMKSLVIRTLWIHDIPEIIDSQTSGSDMTSIDKIRNPDLALAVKIREQAIIEDIFSKEDKDLYRAFDPAKEMLFTGKIDYTKTTPVGLISRILDNFIEGTNSFHGFVTEYLLSEEYDPQLPLPFVDSFEYCFQRAIDVHKHVSCIDHPDYLEAREVMLNILEKDFFEFVEELWTPRALERLPNYALQEYRKYIESVPMYNPRK